MELETHFPRHIFLLIKIFISNSFFPLAMVDARINADHVPHRTPPNGSGFELGIRPKSVSKCFQMAVRLKQSIIGKSCALPSRGGDVFIKARRWKRISGSAHRVGWSLGLTLGEMIKPWFRRNCRWCTEHGFASLRTSVVERCTGCLVGLEGCTSRTINHRLPVGYEVLISSCSLVVYTVWLISWDTVPWFNLLISFGQTGSMMPTEE